MSPRQRSRLFREVNDRIYDLLESGDPDLPGEFLCECGSECGRRVRLMPAAFARLRRAEEHVRSADCPGSGARLQRRRSRPGGEAVALG